MLSKTLSFLPRVARAFGAAAIDPAKLIVELTTEKKEKLPNEELTFGSTFTDHMLEIEWSAEGGWEAPVIKPYQDMSISPAASSLHYGLQCFEGMKAYIDDKDQLLMFRPDMNMKRMNTSMQRLFLPSFNDDGSWSALKKC